ncbi:DNA cytosine methyltransferase [Bacillus tequilensis]|uniref:DNA cytosine methyltransferase n=1 Tax=Bacillus tequilensis TaxID=227866 RepID=UPI0004646D3D|nr:DNA (cytosine-5-)-methyltransferase [Bacillus tequilensis]SPT93207.1 Modification methylase Rho11sI [Bacillus tequilensis]
MNKIRVLSLFSGLGAFEKALRRVHANFEIVRFCEKEAAIAKAYSTLHNIPESKNLGDIKSVVPSSLPEFDLMTYGFPCTDVSVAKVRGEGLKGEESSLLFDALRIAEFSKPKYMIAENVKNLIGKHREGFEDMLRRLEKMGYNNYWSVLDAKDFNIPQERLRVFVVSIRKDIDDGSFSFPSPRPDLKGASCWWNFLDVSNTRNITKRQQRAIDVAKGKIQDPSVKIEGEINFDRTVISHRTSGLRFQSNPHHPTITSYYGTGGGNFTVLAHKGKLGGITPKQCLLLMGFDSEDYEKLISAGISKSTIYIMAGNSIVVNVLEDIFKNLFREGAKDE